MPKHKVIPFGDRILVKRRKIGEKVKEDSMIVLPDAVKERNTDLADVMHVPDLTFADKYILDNAEPIIKAITQKAINGNEDALNALLKLNAFMKEKSVKEGDAIMVGKYVGTDFHTSDNEDLTLVRASEVIGLVVQSE